MAGIIAAAADTENSLCSDIVGVAYGARLAEVFTWDGTGVTQTEMADSAVFNADCIDIKATSYDISGVTAHHAYMEPVLLDALADAAETGRGGLGTVRVLAAGNQWTRANPIRADYDEFVSNRRVIAVGATALDNQRWTTPSNGSETGSCLLACAPGTDMFTTGRESPSSFAPSYKCESGTSYAGPCVAGVVALMLEANPGLAWRDVQEAIVRTAATIDDDPNDPDDWQTNTAGLDHSYEYGHGLVDAYEAVSFVTGTNGDPAWTPLAAESVITLDVAPKGVQVGPGQTRTILLQGDGGLRVEHVGLTMDVTATGAPGIGPLEIEVERLQLQQGDSPRPRVTRSVFAVGRDDTSPSYDDAVFTSVRHWGEQSNATWKVRLRNTSTQANPVTATWNNAELRLYGTE